MFGQFLQFYFTDFRFSAVFKFNSTQKKSDPRADIGLRKDLEKFIEEKRAKSKSTITGQRVRPGLREIINPNGTVQPEYELKHQKNSNLQDFVGQGSGKCLQFGTS